MLKFVQYSSGRQGFYQVFSKQFKHTAIIWRKKKLSCEGQITIEECKRILETFQKNKSPGNDEIPIEFYKTCSGILIINRSLIASMSPFLKEEMSNSQKQAVINLIEKQGKDRTLLENWRPISLVKIISKVIASRVKNVYPITFVAIKLVTLKIAILVRQ